jgi:hypothetical protein
VRSIFVGGDVELALEKIAAIEEVFAGSDFEERVLGVEILQIHFCLGPALLHGNEKPAVVLRESDVRNILGIALVFEDERVLSWIGSELMVESFDVVNLFSSGDVALFRMPRVVEGGTVFHPGQASEAGAVNGIGQDAAGGGFDQMERALFGTAGRGAVGDVFAVFGGVPPVESDGAVGGQFIDVEQNAVFAIQALAHIEDGLVLAGVAAGIEVIPASHVWSVDGANCQ